MKTVIIQIEDKGAYRVSVESVPAWQARVHEERGVFYVVDGCGRTWAPLPDGEYCLWEDNPNGVAISDKDCEHDTLPSDVQSIVLARLDQALTLTEEPGYQHLARADVHELIKSSRDLLNGFLKPQRNRTTGAGSSVKCETCGTLFSGESTRCPHCAEELKVDLECQKFALEHGQEF